MRESHGRCDALEMAIADDGYKQNRNGPFFPPALSMPT
ncbi:hypothetical protein EKH55_3366 [Sinorhizobium alkalisoli]|nr:hypothetical protein EKH55_3366 [Sinorhizobium alkalisoli]